MRADLREWIADDQHVGERIDKALSLAFADLSRSRIKALIEEGQLTLADLPVRDPSAKVVAHSRYALVLPQPRADTPAPEAMALDVLFEDAAMIVINKPAGLAVHPAAGNWTGTLVHGLLHHCKGSLSGIGGVERPGIVHRLDKDTSGVMVVAKSDAAHQALSAQFAARTASRQYLAFCRAVPRPREGVIKTGYGRSHGDRRKFAVEPLEKQGTKTAITRYETLAVYGQISGQSVGTPEAAKLACRLRTGRTHQIRVHLAHIGCPLLGDPIYGKQGGWRGLRNGAGEDVQHFRRQALHAQELSLLHPVTAQEMVFTAPMPDDMAALERFLDNL
jgi:23S rRNA pseudouridine1911/1915/1917 synthase